MRFAESCPRGRNGSTRLFNSTIALYYSNWRTSSRERQDSTALTTSPKLPAPFVIVCGLTTSWRNSKLPCSNWCIYAGKPPLASQEARGMSTCILDLPAAGALPSGPAINAPSLSVADRSRRKRRAIASIRSVVGRGCA